MVSKQISKHKSLRMRICQFRNSHLDKPKVFTVKHFRDEGIPKSTIYDILDRVNNNRDYKRNGRIAKKMGKKQVQQLKRMLNHHDNVSQRQAARRFDCDPSYINKIISTKTDIKYYKKKTIPFRSEEQIAKIKPRCRFLYRHFRGFDIILDDES